tara:strand:- start:8868 stop:9290 length:423 start_codon:yes stop_codon:yes gene_type:complete
MMGNGRRIIGGVLALLLVMAAGTGEVVAQHRKANPKKPPPVMQQLRPSYKKPMPQFYRHDNVQQALRNGEIVSLRVIRRTVQKSYPGRIVDVQLLESGRRSMPYTYMVKVLTPEGQVLNVTLNAKTARILSVRGPKGRGK